MDTLGLLDYGDVYWIPNNNDTNTLQSASLHVSTPATRIYICHWQLYRPKLHTKWYRCSPQLNLLHLLSAASAGHRCCCSPPHKNQRRLTCRQRPSAVVFKFLGSTITVLLPTAPDFFRAGKYFSHIPNSRSRSEVFTNNKILAALGRNRIDPTRS